MFSMDGSRLEVGCPIVVWQGWPPCHTPTADHCNDAQPRYGNLKKERLSAGRPRRLPVRRLLAPPCSWPWGALAGSSASFLDFSDGLRFQDWIFSKFNRPINPIPDKFDRHEFFLVVSFGRCSMRLCPDSVGLLLQSFVGGEAGLFRVSQLADRVFRFSISCKVVGFAVYHLHSYSCSVFKAYLHLWNSGGPNWFIEWQRYSAEESNSWKLVSHRRSSPAPYANMSRKPALSGANLVPLGHRQRSVHAPEGLMQMQRRSVFDRISFSRRSVRNNVAVVRPHFQNYSNPRIGRMVRSGFRSSLETPHVSPWAPRMLVWRPKKILEQCPENFGQDSAPGINGSSVPAASGDRYFRDLSLSGNNSQIFGISGQKCNRPVVSFPDKFVKASWGFPPRL
jgi:hypothetical protein